MPDVEYCDPWQGQTYRLLSNPVTVHPSCVQTEVNAVNASCPVCATRKIPSGVCAIPAEPTAASGDAPSTVMEMTRPDTVEGTTVSMGTLLGPVGLLLPPQPARAPTASSDAAWHAHAQNSRRVCRDE